MNSSFRAGPLLVAALATLLLSGGAGISRAAGTTTITFESPQLPPGNEFPATDQYLGQGVQFGLVNATFLVYAPARARSGSQVLAGEPVGGGELEPVPALSGVFTGFRSSVSVMFGMFDPHS